MIFENISCGFGFYRANLHEMFRKLHSGLHKTMACYKDFKYF